MAGNQAGPTVPSRSNVGKYKNQAPVPEKPSHGVSGPAPSPVKNDVNMVPSPVPSKTK